MEDDWERTFPFLEIDKSKVGKLFETIVEEKNIMDIIPISEGCRTTNYIIETKEPKYRYILKIYFPKEENYKKEIKLFSKLRENENIPVPKIYKISRNEVVQSREYAIYEYIQGITLGEAMSKGYVLEKKFISDVAKSLAQIHSYKFDRLGFLDENLNIREGLPPLIEWYKNFMGNRAKKRLGKEIINKINYIVKENKNILTILDEDIRLVHGDFQGTNILIKNNRLSGILDWEFVMAGHPIADIGQFFRYEEYFNESLVQAFEEQYNIHSSYKLIDNWYKISKLRDLVNLIQLIDGNEDMPNKYANIKLIIVNILKQF